VYHLFVIQTDDRDRLQEALQGAGIETGIHYPIPVHRLPVYQGLGYGAGAFPRAEARARRMLSLPIYPELTAAGIARVTDSIRTFFRG
jgi:dTDP-4-amino-4,6-dideoxygalactose transaminase